MFFFSLPFPSCSHPNKNLPEPCMRVFLITAERFERRRQCWWKMFAYIWSTLLLLLMLLSMNSQKNYTDFSCWVRSAVLLNHAACSLVDINIFDIGYARCTCLSKCESHAETKSHIFHSMKLELCDTKWVDDSYDFGGANVSTEIKRFDIITFDIPHYYSYYWYQTVCIIINIMFYVSLAEIYDGN